MSAQSPAELANQVPEVRAAREMSDLLRRGGSGWLLFAQKMPDIFDAALSVLEARLEQAEKALREVEHYPFDVMKDAVHDLAAVKEIARAALARGVVGETSGPKDTP